MKVYLSLIFALAIGFLVGPSPSSSSTSGQTVDPLQWGQPNDGIQVSLSATDSKGSELQVALRNVSDHDVTLNLGSMMANGQVQLPDYIHLTFTDAQGKTRVFQYTDKKHSFVAGRLDDYVVPLRIGSMYTLKVRMDQYWCQETKELEIRLLPGKNRLTAQYEGSRAKLINLDMAAIKLMNFWLGKVESNTLVIEQ